MKKFKSDYIRNYRQNQDKQYRVNRKIAVNTCDVTYKYKKVAERNGAQDCGRDKIGSENLPTNKKITAA